MVVSDEVNLLRDHVAGEARGEHVDESLKAGRVGGVHTSHLSIRRNGDTRGRLRAMKRALLAEGSAAARGGRKAKAVKLGEECELAHTGVTAKSAAPR